MKILYYILWIFLSVIFTTCQGTETHNQAAIPASFDSQTSSNVPLNEKLNYPWYTRMKESTLLVSQIQVPDGFKRVEVKKGSFADWLRHMPLRATGTKVYYFNDEEKYTQEVHEAVVDIDLSGENLQQSEDAIIRLYAEYLFSQEQYKDIHFQKENGDTIQFKNFIENDQPTYFAFRNYLNHLFKFTSIQSLNNELKYTKLDEMEIGDIFIQSGETGHAAIIIDLAESEGGQKIFMLAQSFIPAQDIHILKNIYQYDMYGAWFPRNFGTTLYTPEWEFSINDLHRF